MSRSFNETSIPLSRGRKTVSIKTKRRSSKKVRQLIEVDSRTERLIRKKFLIDK